MKYEIIHFGLSERNLFENYLNEMGKLGWHIQWISMHLICFKKEEKEISYLVDISENVDERQMDMYKEFGCDLVCEDNMFKVFSTDTENSSAHSDLLIENNIVNKRKRKWFKSEFIIPLIWLCVHNSINFTNLDISLRFLSNNGTFLFYFGLILFLLTKLVDSIVKYKKSNINFIKTRTKVKLCLEIFSDLLVFVGITMLTNLSTGLLALLLIITIYFSLFLSNYFKSKSTGIGRVVILVSVVAIIIIIVGNSAAKNINKHENPMLLSDRFISDELEFVDGIDNSSILLDYKVAMFDAEKGFFDYYYVSSKYQWVIDYVTEEKVINHDAIDYYSNKGIIIYRFKNESIIILKKANEIIEIHNYHEELTNEYIEKLIIELNW